MNKLRNLFQNRDFIMTLALAIGLLWGKGAHGTEPATLPVLAIVMTLSTMGVRGNILRSHRTFLVQALAGIAMNYLVLGSFLLVLSALFIHDEAIRSGFVIIAAVPPAVAVIPFTLFLNGNHEFSLIGTIGAYLGALVITPLLTVWLLGSGFVNPSKLFMIMVELILAPLILSRILVRTGVAARIEPVRGTIVNWSFFILTYTIVGLNRDVFLSQPLSLIPAATLALASTFLLGWIIEGLGRIFRIQPKTSVSLVLLGTLKNYGLAGGLALALFNDKTALPATVSTVFMIAYIIWLQVKRRVRRSSDEKPLP